MSLFFSPVSWICLLMALLLHWCVWRSERAKILSLLVFSLVTIFQGHFEALLIALAVPLLILAMGRGKNLSGATFWVAVGALIGWWLASRYGDPRLSDTRASLFERFFSLPLGMSFFVFRCVGYLAERYRGQIREESFSRLALFLFFAPSFPCGPLTSYRKFYSDFDMRWDGTRFANGLCRLTMGLFKKIVFVDFMFLLYAQDFCLRFSEAIPETTAHYPLKALAFVVLQFLRAYGDLSAYSDMAIGASLLFGIRLPENFQRPLLATSPADFWRRWHVSLSQWCREQVYFPLYAVTRKSFLCAYAVMLVIGFWHGLTLNWFCWALYHGTGMWAAVKFAGSRQSDLISRWAGRAFTFCFVAIGYSFVATPSLSRALQVMVACLRAPLALWH